MENKAIIRTHTDNAPKAIGPYSQGSIYQGIFYSSGQIPLDPVTMKIVGETVSEQAKRILETIDAILESNGINETHVIKTTCYLSDMLDFADFNVEYGKYFKSNPSRTCIAAKDLPQGVLCEIEFIAHL